MVVLGRPVVATGEALVIGVDAVVMVALVDASQPVVHIATPRTAPRTQVRPRHLLPTA